MLGALVVVAALLVTLLWSVTPCLRLDRLYRTGSFGRRRSCGVSTDETLGAAAGPLVGQTVLLTGGGGGVGSEIVRSLAARGARCIAVWDVNATALASVGSDTAREFGYSVRTVSLDGWGGSGSSTAAAAAGVGAGVTPRAGTAREVLLVCVDLTDPASVDAAFAATVANLPSARLDVLINNAAVVNGLPATAASAVDRARTFRVNFEAPIQLMQLALRHWSGGGGGLPRERRNLFDDESGRTPLSPGQLVTVASSAGLSYAVGLSDYCASKAALIAYHRALRLELLRAAADSATLLGNPLWACGGGVPRAGVLDEVREVRTLLVLP